MVLRGIPPPSRGGLDSEQKMEVCREGGGPARVGSGEWETDKRLKARSGKATQQKQEKCRRQKVDHQQKSKIQELLVSQRGRR